MFERIRENPILVPDKGEAWEAYAAFNPCVVKVDKTFHMLYRGMSLSSQVKDVSMSISSIGYAVSEDGIHFKKIRQLIKPEHIWETFGCEDPRITKLGDKYYILYTALSAYPFSADGIKIGLAISKDLKTIDAKYSITTFNSKAMALFPEKINGKMAAVLTVHTDIPPGKIALALFDKEEKLWSKQYWNEWYSSLNYHIIPLLRSSNDHIEVGAPPIKTEHGWLLIYSYIHNYFSSNRIFSIEAALLDLENPLKIIGRTDESLLVPQKIYELDGNVPDVIFPSGAHLEKNELYIYYGASDTSCCVAKQDIKPLLESLVDDSKIFFISGQSDGTFERYAHNPIIRPRPEIFWEAKCTFNPAVIYADKKVHIIYRAMSHDDVSVWGYATSRDGYHIDERSPNPIYVPTEIFERKLKSGNSGCEDPRITKFGDRFYVFYTAFDGYTHRVAFTSILEEDFLNGRWNWERAKVITSPNMPDKNACLLSKKIKEKYVIFHRQNNNIYIDFLDDLLFGTDHWLNNETPLIEVEHHENPNILKVGMSAPPIETDDGWLLLYHWVVADRGVSKYKVGVALLELENPAHVINKDGTLLQPEMDYEKNGVVSNVVFPCGAILLNGEILVYYGGADKVVAVAKMKLSDILNKLKK